jgi:hypothetical protein
VQYRDGHISTYIIKTLVIYLCCAYCACASYIFIIATPYFLFVLRYLLLSFIYFALLFDFIIIDSFAFIRCSLFKREKCNSDPELCSGISIPLLLNIIIRINKHHTADSTDFVLV